jgi:predicted metal-dependent peptidase
MDSEESEYDLDACRDQLSLAKIRIMTEKNSVFFSTVVLRMDHEIKEDIGVDGHGRPIKTAATDGLKCYYHPEFWSGLTQEERAGLVLHETMHVILEHPLRRMERHPGKYNDAGDYAANLIIDQAGFELPTGGLLDYAYENMSTEEIYDLLPEPPEDDGNNHGGSIGMDLLDPFEGMTPAEKEKAAKKMQQDIDDILVQATVASRTAGDAPGTIPGHIERYVEELLNPKIPWYRYMHQFKRALARDDYSFRRPNRRFLPDMILPGRDGEKMDRCAFIVDASGSVSDEEFSHMIGETAKFMKDLRPELVNFIQFDTHIKTNDELRTLRDLRKVDFHGRGGTRIDEVFEWINENKPVVSVIFTDGYFNMPEENLPKTPIIWIIHDNPTWESPVGKVIHFEYDV